ncbi:RNA polymerase sigma factor [Paenibacillus monticola]|uniref:Sigma-70 family RNA polymerase sigma factor n=1 Tax=Paenibacillus monticola TaxID=2666075 RepID=A0A7X2L404_9BACL|nr:RNA polymerase sigma factor [Paenibacillus monticola]MRN55778.1 sigma-70 family RNA polymerase sigma factor [Paenibacillus monticola]
MSSDELRYAAAYAPVMTLREMMDTYGPDVWNYAYFLTRSREQANDISQEVFLKAYRNIGKYRGQSSVKTWLLTITRNTAFSWSKNSFWRRFITLGDQPLAVNAPSAEQEALGNQYANRIWEIIMELPDKNREVLVLDLQHGLSIAEMSGLLGIAQGTVKSRLARARDKVRKIIEEEEQE